MVNSDSDEEMMGPNDMKTNNVREVNGRIKNLNLNEKQRSKSL